MNNIDTFTMETDFDAFLARLRYGIPFCFVRFNDGEARALAGRQGTVSRGRQRISSSLSSSLLDALQYEEERYIKGIPCPECMPESCGIVASRLADNSDPTLAVLLMNSNWTRTCKELPEVLKSRSVCVLSGYDQDWSKLSPHFSVIGYVPSSDAWNEVDDLYTRYREIPENSVVLLSGGPISRVLAHYWYNNRPDCTFLDVGSCFDPFVKGERHRYQKVDSNGGNKAPYCNVCNPKGGT